MSKNKKKGQEEKKEDNSFKALGNKAFQEKNFDKAIEFYTLAIDEDSSNHILYSNRSAAYSSLKRFEEALKDADECVERQPSWAKGHFRRGCALEGLGQYQEAYSSYSKGLNIEPNDPLLLKASSDLSILMEDLKASNELVANVQNPEHDKFNVMLEWLKSGGAKFPKLYLQYYSQDYRGVHASTRIAEDEIVLEVPFHMIMTSEVAKASEIGKKVLAAEAAGLELRSKHSFLASFLLQEKKAGDESFWAPYMNTLPQHYRNMPIFFDDSELEWIKGSMCLAKIAERKESLRAEYDNLCKYIPEYSQYQYEDFVWARLVVITRIFGLVINTVKTDGLVAMADMLNHKRPRQTKWTFDDARNSFTITSLTSMQRGDQVYDSYGQKCNSRFFVNYGFALEENEQDNEVMFVFDVPRSDPHYAMKLRLLGGLPRNASRDFQIPTNYREKKTREAFAFLRFAHARDAEMMVLSAGQEFKVEDVEPISARNEIEVLRTFKLSAQRVMAGFDTSIEQDEQLLKDPSLTSNQRNCVVVRRGEKQVLQYYIDLANLCIPYLEGNWSQLKKISAKIETSKQEGPFDPYILSVVVPLVKHAR